VKSTVGLTRSDPPIPTRKTAISGSGSRFPEEAEFVAIDGERVKLKRTDGLTKRIQVLHRIGWLTAKGKLSTQLGQHVWDRAGYGLNETRVHDTADVRLCFGACGVVAQRASSPLDEIYEWRFDGVF
jgi:hypothetical protein